MDSTNQDLQYKRFFLLKQEIFLFYGELLSKKFTKNSLSIFLSIFCSLKKISVKKGGIVKIVRLYGVRLKVRIKLIPF
ncbi:MAG: hypothetical protein EAZ92_17400 [Candidatus Kapaibacterium sp.]|nr:MAG: hypothetical protein EAZ92_17400 [Candidatus Kapabacteria bacterium]